MLRCVFIVECGIARFFCVMRVFDVRASFLYHRLPLSNYVSFAASIAELAHGEQVPSKRKETVRLPCAVPTSEKFTVQLCALYFRHDVIRLS